MRWRGDDGSDTKLLHIGDVWDPEIEIRDDAIHVRYSKRHKSYDHVIDDFGWWYRLKRWFG